MLEMVASFVADRCGEDVEEAWIPVVALVAYSAILIRVVVDDVILNAVGVMIGYGISASVEGWMQPRLRLS